MYGQPRDLYEIIEFIEGLDVHYEYYFDYFTLTGWGMVLGSGPH